MRRLAALVALAAAVIASAACEPIADSPSGDTGEVLAVQFGDSLSRMSENPLVALYVNDPVWRVSLNHQGGTEFDTNTWVNRYPSVPAGATVVLALGTNDLSNDSLSDAKADARAAIAAVSDAGAVRVVVPTVNETSAYEFGGQARLDKTQAWNAWLWQAENSLHVDYRALDVVDWAAVSAGRTDWLAADRLHHNVAGEQAYAEFLYGSRLPGGE